MSRLTCFTDIAGRVSLDVNASPRVTAGTVVFPSENIEILLNKLPNALPKWKSSSLDDAEAAVNFINEHALSVGVYSVNKDTEAWRQFWKGAKSFQSAISSQDHRPAGFVKPSNILSFALIGGACSIAIAHALRNSSPNGIVDLLGRKLVERTIICDSDLGGKENLEMFQTLWMKHDQSQPLLNRAGFRIFTREVRVTTEQIEPLLLIADYVAGIAHVALLESPSFITPPHSTEKSKNLLQRLQSTGKLAVQTSHFDLRLEDIFGEIVSCPT